MALTPQTDTDAPDGRATAFLGVTRSALGRRWVDALDADGRRQAQALVQRTGLADALSRVLIARGVQPEDAEHFLAPRLRDLMPDPRALQDTQAATERLLTAITDRQKVVIFGDYDVDGATSSALLWSYLMAVGVEADILIPDRLIDGYGPTPEIVDRVVEQGADLLVTVDCGTTSFQALERARALGLDAIVLDHHQAEEALPPAVAIVNPNRQDDLSGLGTLAAVGVVFMLLVDLNRALKAARAVEGAQDLPDLLHMLDLVALGTVADVARLTGLNRAFVRQGLKLMQVPQRPGLNALMRTARAHPPITAYHLGFLLGPRINAGGRIGDASLGARLLTTSDPAEADEIAQRLESLNGERQALEATLVEAAVAQVEMRGLADDPILVVYGEDGWHPGLIGLVAARLKERYGRPALALAVDGALATGSARSISGVDLGQAVRAAVRDGFALKGGGHAMAAGLTVNADKRADLTAFLSERLRDPVDIALRSAETKIDGALTAAAATLDLCDRLAQAGPFGMGNPEPVFAFPAHRISVQPLRGGHLRVRLRAQDGASVQAMAFRADQSPLGAFLDSVGDGPVHALGTLRRDSYQGRDRVTVTLRDAALPERT